MRDELDMASVGDFDPGTAGHDVLRALGGSVDLLKFPPSRSDPTLVLPPIVAQGHVHRPNLPPFAQLDLGRLVDTTVWAGYVSVGVSLAVCPSSAPLDHRKATSRTWGQSCTPRCPNRRMKVIEVAAKPGNTSLPQSFNLVAQQNTGAGKRLQEHSRRRKTGGSLPLAKRSDTQDSASTGDRLQDRTLDGRYFCEVPGCKRGPGSAGFKRVNELKR